MKKITCTTFLIIIIGLLPCTKIYATSEELRFSDISYSVNSDTTITYCSFSVATTDTYYVYLWMHGIKNKTGKNFSYKVYIDNKLVNILTPSISDWHYECLYDGLPLYLNKGKHVLSVNGTVPDVPQIEHIYVSKTQRSSNSVNKYNTFKSNILKSSSEVRYLLSDSLGIYKDQENISTYGATSPPYEDVNNPPYAYTFLGNVSYKYTYFKKFYFKEGIKLYLQSIGQYSFNPVIELFSEDDSPLYSFTSEHANNYAQLNAIIPKSGFYFIRVRSVTNNEIGLCNLAINDEIFLDSLTAYTTGFSCYQDTLSIYNTFTTNNRNGNPSIYIEGGSKVPGTILSFNNDYQGHNDYNWGVNARTNKKFPKSAHAVQINSYSSYNPEGVCDIYIKCKRGDKYDFLDSLADDDYIISSYNDCRYNCIAWTGGIYNLWIWPPYEFSDFYNKNAALSFANFYSCERYIGCARYTNKNATRENSVIDLYGSRDSTSEFKYTHATICNGADYNKHGYAWESKLGELERVFHPRFSVECDLYGKATNYFILEYPLTYSLDESILKEKSTIEYEYYNDEEKQILENQIQIIPLHVIDSFNTLINPWRKHWNNSMHSNPDIICNCTEYSNILDYCKKNKETTWLVLNELEKGDISCVPLTRDLLLSNNMNLLEKIKKQNKSKKNDSKGRHIVRSIHTNAVKFAKQYLRQYSTKETKYNSSVKYSNSDEYETFFQGNKLYINIKNKYTNNAKASLVDEYGRIISRSSSICPPINLIDLPLNYSGLCYLHMYIDGRINIKKIFIHN